MAEVKHVGKTYAEHLKEVRDRQFGRVSDDITPITENTQVTKPKPKKPSKKEVKADE